MEPNRREKAQENAKRDPEWKRKSTLRFLPFTSHLSLSSSSLCGFASLREILTQCPLCLWGEIHSLVHSAPAFLKTRICTQATKQINGSINMA